MGQVVMVDPVWGDWAAQVVHRAARVLVPLSVLAVVLAIAVVAWRVRRRSPVATQPQAPAAQEPAEELEWERAGEGDVRPERWPAPWQRPGGRS